MNEKTKKLGELEAAGYKSAVKNARERDLEKRLERLESQIAVLAKKSEKNEKQKAK